MAKLTVNPSNYVTDALTFSYAQVWEAKPNLSGKLKYSACLLLPKKNKDEKARWDAAILAAIEIGIKKKLFTRNQIPILKTPIRDGDYEIKVGKRKKGQGYEDNFFINANSNDAPAITKPQSNKAVPIIDQKEFYSGVIGRAIISFYAYDEGGSQGVAVGLNGCYKLKDGPRLDGRVDAVSVFDEFAKEDDDIEGVDVEGGEDTADTSEFE